MINVFIPTDKKVKSAVRGLWRSDSGKVYYDYLRIQEIEGIDKKNGHSLAYYLDPIKEKYNQEAIAYIKDNQLKIYFSINKIDTLTKKIVFDIGFDRHNLKGILKRVLRDYKGLTIYQVKEGYIIEAYYHE